MWLEILGYVIFGLMMLLTHIFSGAIVAEICVKHYKHSPTRTFMWGTLWPLAILWFGFGTIDKIIKEIRAEEELNGN